MIASFITGSLALLADAGHMLTDVAGVALALFAMTLAQRPATPERTYGYYRAEILAVMANADDLYFQAISRTGTTIDNGAIRRRDIRASAAVAR